MSLGSGRNGEKNSGSGLSSDTRMYANELNDFYCRFGTYDFSTERNNLSENRICIASEGQKEALTVMEDEVLIVLTGTNQQDRIMSSHMSFKMTC